MSSRPIKDEQLPKNGEDQPVYGGNSQNGSSEVKIQRSLDK